MFNICLFSAIVTVIHQCFTDTLLRDHRIDMSFYDMFVSLKRKFRHVTILRIVAHTSKEIPIREIDI